MNPALVWACVYIPDMFTYIAYSVSFLLSLITQRVCSLRAIIIPTKNYYFKGILN